MKLGRVSVNPNKKLDKKEDLQPMIQNDDEMKKISIRITNQTKSNRNRT